MSEQRRAQETQAERMAPLTRLPLFFELHGRRVLVAGAGSGAAWKVELLTAAGAAVTLCVEAPDAALEAEAAAPAVTLHRRGWQPADLEGVTLAIGGFEVAGEAERFAAAARAAGVPVNLAAKSGLSDFTFSSIVNRSPLVLGISTDGAAPIFAQAIRARLESVLPRGLARWTEAARRWRDSLAERGLPLPKRQRFWRRFAERALARPGQEPGEADRQLLLDEAAAAKPGGALVLVGAGPGDPELLTLKAVHALQSADVILYDDLVAPEILDLARRETRRLQVGKKGFGPSVKQDEINRLIVELGGQGQRIVRLKGGDPLIFGRAGEEMTAALAAGLRVEIVPGITSAQGAAAALGRSLTHRDLARRLQFVTGHAKDGRLPQDLDWPALADGGATTVVYMPQKTLAELAARLVAQGLDPATPAVAVAQATRPGEQVIAGSIATLPALLAEASPPGPVLVLYGRAVGATTAGA